MNKLPQLDVSILEDPIKFTKACWPEIRLYNKQAEVLESLRYNYETTVHAANEVGKDFTAAIAVVWWFASRRPARVITSSSGESQLKNILWSEIRQRISTSRFDFGWNVGELNIKRENDPLSYIIGHVTKTVENFQGHHLDHDKPRVLCVFDECSGVGDTFHEAAQSWAHAILNIGNPMNTRNYFYKTVKAKNVVDPINPKSMLSNVIHIDGEDSPNVIMGKELEKQGLPPPYPNVIPGVLSYAEYVRRKHKWDKIKQQIRLHGLFYEGAEELLYPPDWLDLAEMAFRAICLKGYDWANIRKPVGTVAMGVDAGQGRDLTCWTVVDSIGLVMQDAIPTPDTHKISVRTKSICERFRIDPIRVCFDAGGGGQQIVDHMRATDPKYKELRTIAFGSSATPPPQEKTKTLNQKQEKVETGWICKNKRAEMYANLRYLLDPSTNERPFAIPEELDLLREELAILPMWFDGDGKMFLPPKDHRPGTKENPDEITIKKLIGRSPDRADSLVLAIEARDSRVRRIVGAIR